MLITGITAPDFELYATPNGYILCLMKYLN